MNIITAALVSLSALWSIMEVNSLQCYSCTNVGNNTECNQLPKVTCDSSSSYCFTQVEKLVNSVKITKRCSQSNECNSGNYNVGLASKHTSCCSGDLCNVFANGKTSLTYNTFVIMAAFLVLCMFKNV
ncbi:ly6/PLAUR domain-containing protein 6-like [Bufo gargarizans]|uniref:ly6/PLAUR domain-containing protein 6-like n=1 Tax=Bufo gargarizans TaxID=30331 RepID=UPI001CF1B000|nr:ly6/PLAUR domain-containing protein 6-like [Bufo gargarizans]